MNTKVSWIDQKRVMVETPFGDDFIVGFHDESNFFIERNSAFRVTQDLGRFFDTFYKGDSSVIMGEINRQMFLHCYGMIFFYQTYKREQKDEERIRIGKRIKELRLEKGYDAKTLASVAGIDAANLCRIEAGKYSVGFDILTKIAVVCGKKVDFVDLNEDDHECIVDVRPK